LSKVRREVIQTMDVLDQQDVNVLQHVHTVLFDNDFRN